MTEDKKDIMIINIQKNIEEIKIQAKKIKYNMKCVNIFLLVLLSVVLVVSMLLIGLSVSFKHNLEDKFKTITIEYNKVKLLENRFKKLIS
ncbi:hypothetical protein [Candidatus Fukatsuia anoeciicola]|uniref:hypothetical protein n=1 Tax=Candidatus Fukatsuia anoeciicola TaxID=2994492 RepID=UPI003464BB1B